MKQNIICLFFFCPFFGCKGQQPFGTELLKLEKEIRMPHVKGRIDHMAFNQKDMVLYVAALGNNTVEVIDLKKGVAIKSIKGVQEPQGLAYLTEQNEIAVASGGNGDCVFFNTATYEKVAIIHLAGDADNIRYDATERKMYVGYGNGGMAMIDPATHEQIGDVKLPAHPESFQLDKKNNRLYVNLPDDHSIAVIDLKNFTVANMWKIDKYGANFPMSLDTANNLVFVGFRHPAVLAGYNALNGKQISTNDLVDDVDDIFYYTDKQEVIASGGEGSINIFKKEKGAGYKRVADIPTRNGARTSFFIPSLQTFILAERANSGQAAAIAVYSIKE
jgi:DNA-binding beta-propeller fold protein YncE